MKFDITISIVLYKSNIELLENAIQSVYKTSLNFKLYLVDNSPTEKLKVFKKDDRCEYIHVGQNLGFGKAHNIAMERAIEESKYHIVLNPDIYFAAGELEKLFAYMEANPDVGQVMPKVLYPNGDIQRLCKLLPSPLDLFLRRFFSWFPGAEERNRRYELQDSGYDKIMNIPFLSGCFMFLRTSALKKVGLFDKRLFMYIEDVDLTRRIHEQYKTIFFPLSEVHHHYAKGSYKSMKLMLYNIHGAAIYFMKWGWLFDSDRKKINRRVIELYLQ